MFWSVLNRERQGGYLGGTVQVIPHVTDEIKSRVYAVDDGRDGRGHHGDRRHRRRHREPALPRGHPAGGRGGRDAKTVLYIHVTLIVAIPGSGELKSKPTQHSVKELLSVGIQPDILVCRTDGPIT